MVRPQEKASEVAKEALATGKPVREILLSKGYLTAAELDDAVQSLGWPRFRSQQVREWVFGRGVLDPERMTNLSKRDRLELAKRFDFGSATTAAKHASTDGTLKLGYHLNDPERVVRDAVGLVVAKAEAACGVKIMLGRPS